MMEDIKPTKHQLSKMLIPYETDYLGQIILTYSRGFDFITFKI